MIIKGVQEMTDVIKTVLPVLVMMAIGMFCKSRKLITKSCIDGMKFLVVNIMLPVAVFHGLSTASFTKASVSSIGLMLFIMIVTFLLGFALRPLVDAPYNRYLPFFTCAYEGGMIAYPLYTSLVGMENLSVIAMIDISGLLFTFAIFSNVLKQMESGEKANVKKVLINSFKTPGFDATVLGVVMSLTGIMNRFLETAAGDIYVDAKDMIVKAMTPMVLIVVGYEIEFSKEVMRPVLKSVVVRAVLQLAFGLLAVMFLHNVIGSDRLLDIAVIMYMMVPASFSVQTFMKNEYAGKFISSSNSMYIILTIIGYAIMAGIVL